MGRNNFQRDKRNGGRNQNSRRSRGNQNNFKKNRGSRNDQLPEMAPPPMSYVAKPNKQNITKVSWKIGKNEDEEKLAVYDDTSNEDYLRTLIEFRQVIEENVELKENKNIAQIIKMFRKVLKGSAKTSFIALVTEAEEAIKAEEEIDNVFTYKELDGVINQTTYEILGHDAFDNQIEYLKNTKKLRNLSVDEWMKRIRTINFAIKYMADDARYLSERELIRDVILPNLPPLIKVRIKKFGGETMT